MMLMITPFIRCGWAIRIPSTWLPWATLGEERMPSILNWNWDTLQWRSSDNCVNVVRKCFKIHEYNTEKLLTFSLITSCIHNFSIEIKDWNIYLWIICISSWPVRKCSERTSTRLRLMMVWQPMCVCSANASPPSPSHSSHTITAILFAKRVKQRILQLGKSYY